MMTTTGPVLVRIPEKQAGSSLRRLLWLRTLLLLVGLGGVGFYGYQVADEHVYQAYQNWAFDQQINGHRPVNFLDYLRKQTPLAVVLKSNGTETPTALDETATPSEPAAPRPAAGALLGRVEVPRLHLSAIVREGADAETLSRAVGHVPSTALPGRRGNVAIAAHRDTLFRALKDIRVGDLVTFQTANEDYSYEVFLTRIVKPSEVSVLRPDGGFSTSTRQLQAVADHPSQLLTMITCYPFYYVGSAPQRFIVQAKLVPSSRHAAQSD